MNKKIISLLLCFVLLLSFSAALFGCEEAEETSKEQSVTPQESIPEEESKTMVNVKDLPDYGNVTLGKAYTRTALYPNDSEPSYPDDGNKSMTDGEIASSTAKYSDKTFMGFNKSISEYTSKGYAHVTVDLGGIFYVDKFTAHVASAYHESVGISAPQYVDIMVSHDGESWYKAGRAPVNDTAEVSCIPITLELEWALTARYVQYRFIGHSNWIMVCEVEAFGAQAEEELPYPEEGDVQTFLFIGNSSTYFFDVPTKFMYIAESAGINIDVSYCCVGGAYLSQFADANDEKHGKALRAQLEENNFDYVVLQDNGNADYEDSRPACDILVPMLRETGATVHLYKRYSSNDVPANRLESAYRHEVNYTRLAEAFDIEKVAPGADAFLICERKYPELVIYHTDNSHHSDLGAYLLACVMAVTYLDIDLDDVTYTAGFDADTVAKIKDCARIACEEGFDYPQDK